jgi:hypothetical protein
MPAVKNCLTVPEIASLYAVPASTVRLAIDRLHLGHRFNRSRLVYVEDLDQLEAAFKTLGYRLPGPARITHEEPPTPG